MLDQSVFSAGLMQFVSAESCIPQDVFRKMGTYEINGMAAFRLANGGARRREHRKMKKWQRNEMTAAEEYRFRRLEFRRKVE